MPGDGLFEVPFSPTAQRNAIKATTSWKQLSEWAADLLREPVTEDSLLQGPKFVRLLKHIYPGKILCCVVLDYRRDDSVTVPLVTSLARVTENPVHTKLAESNQSAYRTRIVTRRHRDANGR